MDNYTDDFILYKRIQGVSASTLKDYEYALNKFYAEGGDLTKGAVNGWIKKQLDNNVKTVTINHYIRHIRAYVYWCIEEYDLPSFKIKLLKEQEIAPKFFSDSDIKKLLAKPPKNSPYCTLRTWVMVNFIIGTACRANTVVNIKKDDIQDGMVILRETKSKKAKALPLTPQLQLILNQWCRKCRGEYLFSSSSGKKLDYEALRSSFVRYCDSRGVAQHNIHGLRHTFARILLYSELYQRC